MQYKTGRYRRMAIERPGSAALRSDPAWAGGSFLEIKKTFSLAGNDQKYRYRRIYPE